jgi:hypothetical protein
MQYGMKKMIQWGTKKITEETKSEKLEKKFEASLLQEVNISSVGQSKTQHIKAHTNINMLKQYKTKHLYKHSFWLDNWLGSDASKGWETAICWMDLSKLQQDALYIE